MKEGVGYNLLDLDSWNRKEHFQFFNQFEEPFFGICVDVDCTFAYRNSKSIGTSFFIYYLFHSLRTVNEVKAFRYRIDADNNVRVYDRIDASPTIDRADGTFGFSYMDYNPDFEQFSAQAKKMVEEVKASSGLMPSDSGDNVVHYSTLPWVKFTSLSHARHYKTKDSCPKISFGKMSEKEDKWIMPMSIHANHALVDGAQVAEYVEKFQQYMDKGL